MYDNDFLSDESEDADFDSDDFEIIEEEKNESTMESFLIMKETDVRQRMEDDIQRVSTVLSIPRVAAILLLIHYNWSVSKVNDVWFADQDSVGRKIGLLEKPIALLNAGNYTCGICFESCESIRIKSAGCGHPFCVECWREYVMTAINDGPGCLMMRCPVPGCGVAVGEDMVNALASSNEKKRYSGFLVRSYIEENRKIKWCPGPGCEYVVEFDGDGKSYDVTCLCSYMFCWNCKEEVHRPVDCETVGKWILKNSAESENTTWILAKTKPCPKCSRPIEKNQGCMHMTCSQPCNYEFCWLCLGSWKDHCLRTGVFNACNRYEASKQEGVYDETEKRREMARKSLVKYTHYYERWATNQKSMQKALTDLHEMQTEDIEKLSKTQSLPVTQLGFITEAWQQIVECRRVLKWTYAYGYYLPEDEHAKIQFFEYLQGEAESGLERLHLCTEKELQVFLLSDAERPSKDFNAFRTKLVGLTTVTRNYFENLVTVLENGLSDVSSHGGTSKRKGKSSKRKL